MEQQVVAFRVLPPRPGGRRLRVPAARGPGELLLGDGQEDVAKILNEMAPDDRTRCSTSCPGRSPSIS